MVAKLGPTILQAVLQQGPEVVESSVVEVGVVVGEGPVGIQGKHIWDSPYNS